MLCCGFVLWTAVQCTRFYLMTCFTDPGGLASGEWAPSQDELRLMQSVVGAPKSWAEIKATKQIAFCRHCERHRPLRAHHCRDCDRCVLRQDHHCPWVTNCVGYHNQKWFILFMGYGVAGLASVLFFVGIRAFQLLRSGGGASETMMAISAGMIIATAIDGILSFSLCLAISMLLGYQLWCLMRNTSTIEHYDYDRRETYARRHGSPFIYPYDHGWRVNLKTFFGRSIWDALRAVPTAGDGQHESISEAFLKSLEKGVHHWHIDVNEDSANHANKMV